MNQYDIKYIDNLIKYLPNPNINNQEESKNQSAVVQNFWNVSSQLFTNFNRIKNVMLEDGNWYDEAHARQLLLDYINKPECKKSLICHSKKILEIYDRLANLSNGLGTWADGIDREFLLVDDEEIDDLKEEDTFLCELKELILDDVFINSTQRNDKPKFIQEDYIPVILSDSNGQNHSYNHIQTLQPPTTKQLFHIHADEFGASSELEGNHLHLSVQYLHAYLTASQNSKKIVPTVLLNELSNAFNLNFDSSEDNNPFKKIESTQSLIKTVQSKIDKAFKSKEPLLLMGGWTGVPSGHAIYYEIIPTSDQKASFRLYNTGSGIKNHHQARDGNKIKQQTYCEWKDIDKDKLQSIHFLEAICEMKNYENLPHTATKSEFCQKDVYIGLKSILNPKTEKIGTALYEQLMMSAQRSGICSWKSLMAFMRTKMKLDDYKRFKCDIKLQSLIDYVAAHSVNENVKLQDWRLVRRSHQNLSRAIVTLYQKKLVGDKYIHDAQKALQPISEWLKKHSNCRYIRQMDLKPFCYRKCSEAAISHQHTNKTPLVHLLKVEQSNEISLDPYYRFLVPLQELYVNDPTYIDTKLKKFILNVEKAWHNREDFPLYRGLIQFVSSLEIKSDFWEKAIDGKSEMAELLITKLGNISKYFLKSCFVIPEAHVIYPEKIYVFRKILYLQEQLYQLGYPKSHEVSLGSGMPFGKKELFLGFSDAKIARGMALIENHNSNKKEDRYILDSERSTYLVGLERNFKEKETENKKLSFEDLIRNEFPEVIAKIAEAESTYEWMPTFSQSAHLFASDLLPGWLKAMRNTHLACTYVEKSSVGTLHSLNRNSDIEFSFEIIEEEEKSTVTVTLTGVNSDIFQIPPVEKIKLNGFQRYAGQYRPIATKSIQQLITFVSSDEFPNSEKELLSKNYHNKKCSNNYSEKLEKESLAMTDEDFKKLARLFLITNVQLIETLEYFTMHPEKLKEADYQTLFHMLLFKPGVLLQNLKINGFSKILVNFIQKNYEQFKAENEIQAAVFFLRIAHQLGRFFGGYPFLQTTASELYKILNSKGLELETKCLVIAEWISQLGQKNDLTLEELSFLVAGSVYINEQQAHMRDKEDPTANQEIRAALAIHADKIQKALEKDNPNQKLLNFILKFVRNDETSDKKWVMHLRRGQFPHFYTEDGAHTLYPILSKLISPKVKALLPIAIRQHPLFIQLFPEIDSATYCPGNIFALTDMHGKESLIHLKEDKIVIEQKMQFANGSWCRFIPATSFLKHTNKNTLKSDLGSRYLVHHYTHWESLEEKADRSSKIFVVNPSTEKCEYILNTVSTDIPKKVDGEINKKDIDPTGSCYNVNEVRSVVDDLKLGKPSKLFALFEDPSYIHEFYNDQETLCKIELPRFKLTFKPDSQYQGKFTCEHFPKFHLNSNDPVPCLGTHHHYILMQNDRGHHKVILPYQKLKAPKKKEVLIPRYEIDRELYRENKERQYYFVYDIQKNGKLFNKSIEANLYLSLVLGTAQEYNKAAYYLKKSGEKLSGYSVKEAEVLKAISQISQISGDNSSNVIFLQLQASFLLIKNKFSNHKEVSNEDLSALGKLYDLYLSHYHSITLVKLMPQEELFILKNLFQEKFDACRFLRFKELDPLSAQKLQLPTKISSGSIGKPKNLEGFEIKNALKNGFSEKKPLSHTLLTRPLDHVQNHFLYYYDLARKGDEEEKLRLKLSLLFMRLHDQGQHSGMANFFEILLQNPAAFPDPLTEKSFKPGQGFKAKEAWKLRVKNIALSLLDKRVKNSDPHNIVDITKSNFRFDEKEKKIADIQLKYPFPSLTSLASDFVTLNCFKEIPKEHNQESTHELEKTLKEVSGDDPVEKKEFTRLQIDLKAYIGKPLPNTFTTAKSGLNEVAILLAKDKEQDIVELAQLEKDLLNLANKDPNSDAAQVNNQLKKWGGLRKVITLDELIVNFATQDATALIKRNCSLEPADINALYEMTHRYLLYATRNQQRNRAEALLQKALTHKEFSQEYNDLINQLASTLLAERNHPRVRPAYFVFEYYADILMRKTQVDKLEKFLSQGDLNPVMEMIMGSGKSKVLLPLLGLLRADGKVLSMLIVPQPLFESVSHDTKTALQDAFHQNVRSLHFERDTKFSTNHLEIILDDLNNAIKNRECLIMTSKSLQCFILKFIEKCTEHFNSSNRMNPFSEELQIMQKIITTFKSAGCPIIDEADTVLNVLYEVCFSGGNRLSPRKHELDLISAIYNLIYENDELRNIARLQSDPNPNPNAPILTEQMYFDEFQIKLTSALIDQLGWITFESEQLTKKMNQFILKLDPKDKEKLKLYLLRDKDHIDIAQQFFDSLDDEIQDIIALAGEEIAHLLPYTLTRVCDEKYGLDNLSESPLAIPYSAVNTPNSGSQFANAHITMNYTFQTYLKKGITAEVLEAQIKVLQGKAMREMVAMGGKMELKETSAWKIFCTLKGNVEMPLFKYKPTHIGDVLKRINKSPSAKCAYVCSIVLPQMELFKEKISCNPHNLVALFDTISGFTGTLWNGISMHHFLDPEPEVGTDAKTLSILCEHSRTNAISIKEGTTEQMLKQLKEQSIAYQMISDAGGYFKEGDNDKIAHQIASTNQTEVVFYNSQGEQFITDGDWSIPLAQSNTSENDRLTFLDQSRTTGADVPQKNDAIGLVTIGRNMLLRDLLQSVWRLRGLDKSQRVRFLISEEVAGIIRQKLKLPANQSIQFDKILKFVIANQAKQQGRDNYKALKQELAAIPQQILLNVLLHDKLNPEARLQAFSFMSSHWIKPAILSSKDLYGILSRDQSGAAALESNKIDCIKKIDELFTKMPWLEKLGVSRTDCLLEIKKISVRVEDSLPATLPTRDNHDDQAFEVEGEAQKKREVQKEARGIEIENDQLVLFKKENRNDIEFFKEKSRFIDVENDQWIMLQKKNKNEIKLQKGIRQYEIEKDQAVEQENKNETETETQKETQAEIEIDDSKQYGNSKIEFVASTEMQEFDSFALVVEALNNPLNYATEGNNEKHFSKLPIFSLKSFLEHKKDLKAYSSVFEGIHLTLNTLDWKFSHHYKPENFEFLNFRRIPFHHLLVKDSKVILLSQKDVAEHRKGPEYYNLTLGFNDPSKKPKPDAQFKILKLKFLNGEAYYNLQEIELLKKWFKSQGAVKMRTFFLDRILKGYPSKTQRYANSPLQKLFNDCAIGV